MAKVIKNDASSFHSAGSLLTMTIDATNNEVETDISDTAAFEASEAQWWFIQVQCSGGAFVTYDGSDPTGSDYFILQDEFSNTYEKGMVRNMRFARGGAADGKLVLQPLES
jgi:hypothetical protein